MKVSEKDDCLFLDSGKLNVYIPQKYFDKKIATMYGDHVESLGFIMYKYYNKSSDDKPSKIDVLNLPTFVTFYPNYTSANVIDRIYPDSDEAKYTIMTFEAGSKILLLNTIQSLDNVSKFLDTLIGGDLDNNIPYDKITNAWLENLLVNDRSLGIPYSIMSMIVSELYRYKKDRKISFAQALNKYPNIGMRDYIVINFRELCGNSSVLAGLAFEDMNQMLDMSLNMTSDKKEQSISPLEKMLWM